MKNFAYVRTTSVSEAIAYSSKNLSALRQAADMALRDAQPLTGNEFKVELAKPAIHGAMAIAAKEGEIA